MVVMGAAGSADLEFPMSSPLDPLPSRKSLILASALVATLVSTSSAALLDGVIPGPLDRVPVPRPANLAEFVKDEQAATLLGKALFWDQQVGSDGRQACASCHHAAGADPRFVNQMNPGPDGVLQNVRAGGRLRPTNFPILTDDVVGSGGVVDKAFVGLSSGRVDRGIQTPNPVFGTHQQVTGRNTPSAINAIFNATSFWDGRASNTFNGKNPSGAASTMLQVQADGSVVLVPVALQNSSAASQADGPPNSDVEMAWAGRTFSDLGKKMLHLRPLGTQAVHPDDSLLGSVRNPAGNGLDVTYAQLISDAFLNSWWDSDVIIDRSGAVIGRGTPNGLDQFSLMEANFSLFWGLAIQLYEATLVSSDSPFDRFARGDLSAMTANQRVGLDLFLQMDCDECHGGSEFTNASVNATDDGAFNFIGVDPLSEDPGNANGEFKTPTLRNVELTGPYFHNGKYLTLREVIDFYNRGGDVRNNKIAPMGLTPAQRDSIVEFLLALTDDRVRFERAPFDHPSLNPANRPALPAVGALGSPAPLRTFLGVSPFNPGPQPR